MLLLPGRFLIPNMASTLRSPTRGVRPPPSIGVRATWLSTVAYPLLGSLLWPGLMLPVSTTYGVLVFACKTARRYFALWFAPTLWACMSTCSLGSVRDADSSVQSPWVYMVTTPYYSNSSCRQTCEQLKHLEHVETNEASPDVSRTHM